MGSEMCIRDRSDTAFSRGEVGIPINGLIWMGDFDHMLSQIEKKMEAGFRCVKLKIGAIDFEKELALLRHIRTHFSSKEIELRVDAVSYTHLRAHETDSYLVCRLLLEKKKRNNTADGYH